MSDLAVNHEDRFSQNEAQIKSDLGIFAVKHSSVNDRAIPLIKDAGRKSQFSPLVSIKPRSEKTGLRGFRQGLIQTGLCSHRRWLEP